MSASAVGAQWFSYSHVVEFGALVFAATMNVRQVISILISYAKYGHTITPLQILGLLTVFAALFNKSISGLLESPKTKGEEKNPLVEQRTLVRSSMLAVRCEDVELQWGPPILSMHAHPCRGKRRRWLTSV